MRKRIDTRHPSRRRDSARLSAHRPRAGFGQDRVPAGLAQANGFHRERGPNVDIRPGHPLQFVNKKS